MFLIDLLRCNPVRNRNISTDQCDIQHWFQIHATPPPSPTRFGLSAYLQRAAMRRRCWPKGSASRVAALSISDEKRTEPGSRYGCPTTLRFSAVQYVTSIDLCALASRSDCLPARPAASSTRGT